MSVVFSRPYRFVPPDRSNLWPTLIQTFRLVDHYLKKKEGVTSYECRRLENVQASIDRGDGILIAPNHCRYADPLVMGWPSRELKKHVYAMASWHLFNEGWFDGFAIRKMGGFSIHREGTDRQSLEAAIDILSTAVRPLILFPEGTTSRMNDCLMPLLEGVTFIARSAARRRAKKSDGRVVIHPVALKYLCETKIDDWAHASLETLETRVGWYPKKEHSILNRTIRVAEALLTLKEIEHLGASQSGDLPARRDSLIAHLLLSTEERLELNERGDSDIRERVRQIRTEVSTQFFQPDARKCDESTLRRAVVAADLAQELLSYQDDYLMPDTVTDTRIVETIQRMQESFTGKQDVGIPLKVVMDFDEPIEVPARKAPRGQADPVLQQLQQRLTAMLIPLSAEARPLDS